MKVKIEGEIKNLQGVIQYCESFRKTHHLTSVKPLYVYFCEVDFERTMLSHEFTDDFNLKLIKQVTIRTTNLSHSYVEVKESEFKRNEDYSGRL